MCVYFSCMKLYAGDSWSLGSLHRDSDVVLCKTVSEFLTGDLVNTVRSEL